MTVPLHLDHSADRAEAPVHDDRAFRAHTDHMLAMLERLRELEQAKQVAPPGTDQFIGYAHESADLARVVFRWSLVQLQLAEESPRAVQAGELSGRPLRQAEPRPLDVILAHWREAQLRLELAEPGSSKAMQAADDVERWREEFRATEELKRGQDTNG